MNVNKEIVKLSLTDLIPWIEEKFIEKYDTALDGLKERFVGIYTILNSIMEQIFELDNLLVQDTTEAALYEMYKPLFDNMVRLLDVMLKEFPKCLDLEFVELFFISVQDRIQILLAHFHQIFHIQHSDPYIINKISNT